MKYPTQSDLWKLDHVMSAKPITADGKSRVLAQFRQIFPLTLFPDDLIVEELRVIWVKREGPWTKEIVTIMATDIACVYASGGLFFGHVHVRSLTGGPEIFIKHLQRADAFKIRSLVEGIALTSREGLKVEHSDLETEKASLLRAGEIYSPNI